MYIGNIPAENYASFLTQTFSVTATASYTLDHAVSNENDIRLVINNVVQQPGSGKAYTASGTTLTLSEATQVGDVMYCVYLGRALQTVNPPNASVGTSQLADNGITTAKIVDDAVTETKLSALANPFASQLLHVRDEKDVTAHGGTAQAGANVRNLNTIKTNEITGASLSSNQITLPTGTYYINASAPAWQVAYNHVYLYNTTDSSVIIYGYNNYVNPTDGYGRSHVHGRFTLASQKVLELRQWMNNTKTHGLGLYSLNTEPSVYAEVEIWRTA